MSRDKERVFILKIAPPIIRPMENQFHQITPVQAFRVRPVPQIPQDGIRGRPRRLRGNVFPLPYRFRVHVGLSMKRHVGMHQHVFPPLYLQFLINGTLFQVFQDCPACRLVQPGKLVHGRVPALFHPIHVIHEIVLGQMGLEILLRNFRVQLP